MRHLLLWRPGLAVRIPRRLLLLALVWSSLFLLAFRPLLQEFDSLEAVLTWIVLGGGATALTGAVMAYLLENWAGWHPLPRWVKTLFPILMSGILGMMAQAVLGFELLTSVPPSIQAILLMLVNWFSSQRSYKGIKDSSYGTSARAPKTAIG